MSQQLARKPTPQRKRKPLIYLVDDELLLLDLAEVTLLREGYSIKKFKDPKVALAAFLRERPRPVLLISDYAMGEMNGLELIERCKAAAPQLKSILLSGTASAEIIDDSPARVDRFMSKPYQPANLTELVRHLLLRRRSF